ncbi:MAG: succinylglutamate desuccinylase/aspartoacylase family protein [Spirochaetota bacterium]
MAKSRVLPLFMPLPRLLALFLTFVLFMAFPLSACASPSEGPESDVASGNASLPANLPTSMQIDSYEIPPWADLSVLVGSEPGPVLMVVAGVHGDEVSGPLAARQLAAGSPPAKGILVILPVASPEALAAGQRWLPGWSDLNRAFPEAGESGAPPAAKVSGIAGATNPAGAASSTGSTQPAGSAYAASDPAYQRADEILTLIASIQPDLLLDLHESDQYWTEGDDPALVMPASARSAELALALLESPGLEGFSFTGPAPAGSLVAAMDGLLGISALLVEAPDALAVAARIAVHRAVVYAAMQVMGMGCPGIGCLGLGCPGSVDGGSWAGSYLVADDSPGLP